MADDNNEVPAAIRNEGYLDLRELIQRFDEMGELARVDGADWNLEIGALSETVAAADPGAGEGVTLRQYSGLSGRVPGDVRGGECL